MAAEMKAGGAEVAAKVRDETVKVAQEPLRKDACGCVSHWEPAQRVVTYHQSESLL